MQKVKYALSALALLCTTAHADKSEEWFLHSSISPDGKKISFSYKGDIYTVASKGSTARPFTVIGMVTLFGHVTEKALLLPVTERVT